MPAEESVESTCSCDAAPGVRHRLWQISLANLFELDRSVAAGAGELDGVGGEFEQHLSGQRVIALSST